MKILLSLIYLFTSQFLFSQIKQADSLHKTPFDTNKIKDAVRLSNTSEVFSYDSLYIWNDKRSLSEIMDARPGYFVNDFGLGGRNLINFNGYTEKDINIFRDGIQINDIFFGGFDIQNISVNEIDRIEEISNVSSFLYGYNSTGKTINVLTKDIFQSKPFSQLRYSQDRFNSLFADLSFNLPFSRKLNWMIGATKHSIDGRYENSEFDSWRGRTRLSFYPSAKFNLKLNFYYDKIDRGLNEGLIYTSNIDSLASATADVNNTNSNEKIENYYYDATLTGRFFKDKNALTKLKIYSINTLREYRNEDTASSHILPYYHIQSRNFHYIQYGVDLKQNLSIKFNRKVYADLLFGADLYFDHYDKRFQRFVDGGVFLFLGKADLYVNNFVLSVFGNNRNKSTDVDLNFNKGIESKYKFTVLKNFIGNLFAGINQTYSTYYSYYTSPGVTLSNQNLEKIYYEFGFELGSKLFGMKEYYYRTKLDRNVNLGLPFIDFDYQGVNSSIFFSPGKFRVHIIHNYSEAKLFPKHYIKFDISYKNIFFRRKLNLQVGINSKYLFRTENDYTYSQAIYDFYREGNLIKKERFNMDFYIGARIGHANINITLANIFDNFYYDSYIYPTDNRGGLGNVVSRFTIVWDFLN